MKISITIEVPEDKEKFADSVVSFLGSAHGAKLSGVEHVSNVHTSIFNGLSDWAIQNGMMTKQTKGGLRNAFEKLRQAKGKDKLDEVLRGMKSRLDHLPDIDGPNPERSN